MERWNAIALARLLWFAGPEALKLAATARTFWAPWEDWLAEVAPGDRA
jgi:hypothetical protein